MITICKTVLSGSAPGQIRDQTRGLASVPLRDMAIRLAADPALTVSVITYEDGTQELEVLNASPPDATEHTIARCSFPRTSTELPTRILSISSPAAVQDAVAMVRAILRDATVS